MSCEKTGYQIYIVQYGEWAIGDAHVVGNCYVFRISGVDRQPERSHTHYKVVETGDGWFDHRKRLAADAPISTLVVPKHDVVHYGYEGTPNDQVQ